MCMTWFPICCKENRLSWMVFRCKRKACLQFWFTQAISSHQGDRFGHFIISVLVQYTVITRSLRHPQSMRHPPIISINILISHNLLTSYEKMTNVECVYKIWWRFMLFCKSYCRNILRWGVSDRFLNLKNASYMLWIFIQLSFFSYIAVISLS